MTEKEIIELLHETIMEQAAEWLKSGDRFDKGMVAGILMSWHVVALRVDPVMAKEGLTEYKAMLWGCEE